MKVTSLRMTHDVLFAYSGLIFPSVIFLFEYVYMRAYTFVSYDWTIGYFSG